MRGTPVVVSHTRAEPSVEELAARVPSRVAVSAVTAPVCTAVASPAGDRGSVADSFQRQSLTLPCWSPVARRDPDVPRRATEVTPSAWADRTCSAGVLGPPPDLAFSVVVAR